MRIIAAVAIALTSSVVPALAAPCKTQGAADAHELTFDLKNDETLRGLRFSFGFGLLPAEFPAKEIAEIKEPCSRGAFTIKSGGNLELFGEDDDSPPRWAKAPSPESPILYIALMPRPGPAAAWADSPNAKAGDNVRFKPEEMMFVVVFSSAESDRRLIFHFFDRIPDDERLKSLMTKIVARETRWQVGFDVKTTGVTPNTQ